ncbi:hypothetical protein SSS_05423 [Sarcoptes scabiei]|uniref:Uncharacterized protein n=2 Tax=Sarcoptes scabiei TaxID=52283 RepID=A0A834R8H6_SARSC|nr:hypothetical protein SSS_05423 [Sarcoptes scabiei]
MNQHNLDYDYPVNTKIAVQKFPPNNFDCNRKNFDENSNRSNAKPWSNGFQDFRTILHSKNEMNLKSTMTTTASKPSIENLFNRKIPNSLSSITNSVRGVYYDIPKNIPINRPRASTENSKTKNFPQPHSPPPPPTSSSSYVNIELGNNEERSLSESRIESRANLPRKSSFVRRKILNYSNENISRIENDRDRQKQNSSRHQQIIPNENEAQININSDEECDGRDHLNNPISIDDDRSNCRENCFVGNNHVRNDCNTKEENRSTLHFFSTDLYGSLRENQLVNDNYRNYRNRSSLNAGNLQYNSNEILENLRIPLRSSSSSRDDLNDDQDDDDDCDYDYVCLEPKSKLNDEERRIKEQLSGGDLKSRYHNLVLRNRSENQFESMMIGENFDSIITVPAYYQTMINKAKENFHQWTRISIEIIEQRYPIEIYFNFIRHILMAGQNLLNIFKLSMDGDRKRKFDANRSQTDLFADRFLDCLRQLVIEAKKLIVLNRNGGKRTSNESYEDGQVQDANNETDDARFNRTDRNDNKQLRTIILVIRRASEIVERQKIVF